MREVTWNVQGEKEDQVLQDLNGEDVTAIIETWHIEGSLPTFNGYSVEKVTRNAAGNMRYYV